MLKEKKCFKANTRSGNFRKYICLSPTDNRVNFIQLDIYQYHRVYLEVDPNINNWSLRRIIENKELKEISFEEFKDAYQEYENFIKTVFE